MFTISDKYKSFVAAGTGLAEVLIALYVKDPALLAAVVAVLGTLFVYAVPNRPVGNQAGYSLVEALLAVFIILVILVVLLRLL
jgi:hypothetical protein